MGLLGLQKNAGLACTEVGCITETLSSPETWLVPMDLGIRRVQGGGCRIGPRWNEAACASGGISRGPTVSRIPRAIRDLHEFTDKSESGICITQTQASIFYS